MSWKVGGIMVVAHAPVEVRTLARTLAAFRDRGKMDVAFGGQTLPGGSAVKITETCGTRTSSLANLVVGNGAGIGAMALSLGRPVSVSSYLAAEGFTHAYDHAVRPEALETVAVMPIFVDRVPRLVIYLSTRAQVGLGTRWFDSLGPLVRKLERDIAVDDEVRKRLVALQAAAAPQAPSLSPTDLVEIAGELEDLAGRIDDAAVRDRVRAVQNRFVAASAPGPSSPTVVLTPREVDVLKAVARGASNREAAQSLGLLENTVKSYLKTAMRKLDATNRVQAVIAARAAGVLR